jgi:hypothetical protein
MSDPSLGSIAQRIFSEVTQAGPLPEMLGRKSVLCGGCGQGLASVAWVTLPTQWPASRLARNTIPFLPGQMQVRPFRTRSTGSGSGWRFALTDGVMLYWPQHDCPKKGTDLPPMPEPVLVARYLTTLQDDVARKRLRSGTAVLRRPLPKDFYMHLGNDLPDHLATLGATLTEMLLPYIAEGIGWVEAPDPMPTVRTA